MFDAIKRWLNKLFGKDDSVFIPHCQVGDVKHLPSKTVTNAPKKTRYQHRKAYKARNFFCGVRVPHTGPIWE